MFVCEDDFYLASWCICQRFMISQTALGFNLIFGSAKSESFVRERTTVFETHY